MGQENLNEGLMGYPSNNNSDSLGVMASIHRECFDCGSRDTEIKESSMRCKKCGSLFHYG